MVKIGGAHVCTDLLHIPRMYAPPSSSIMPGFRGIVSYALVTWASEALQVEEALAQRPVYFHIAQARLLHEIG